MSPEILLGDEFDLSTDLFSLGVIFCEILSRKLADDRVFKRSAPDFGIDAKEVRSLVSPGCPEGLINLALACCAIKPSDRPSMATVLEELRKIELEVLGRASEDDLHVGSLKFLTPGKRPNPAPRIPSFGMGIGSSIRVSKVEKGIAHSSSEESDSDEELAKALGQVDAGLSPQIEQVSWFPVQNGSSSNMGTVKIGHIPGESEAHQPLLTSEAPSNASELSESTATIIIKPKNAPARPPPTTESKSDASSSASTVITAFPAPPTNVPATTDSMMSIDSFHTASSTISVAAATEGGSILSTSTVEGRPSSVTPIMMPHRFTLIKPGAKRGSIGNSQNDGSSSGTGWGPFDFFFFSSGLGLGSKCDLCSKRLGWKPVLECDDCDFRAHIRCGEIAPRNCGTRPGGTRGGNVPLNQLSPSPSKGKLTKART
jgi:LIM domain kinase 1